MPFAINRKCTNCKLCEPECPTHSIFPGKGQFVINSDTCSDCQVCVKICPVDAIEKLPEFKETHIEDEVEESDEDEGA